MGLEDTHWVTENQNKKRDISLRFYHFFTENALKINISMALTFNIIGAQ